MKGIKRYMHILVNYIINKTDGNVVIKEFKDGDKDIVVFDNDGVAIMPTKLIGETDITLIKLENLPFPLVITKKEASELIEKVQKEIKEKEEQEKLNEQKEGE
jgi:hypothetical protein